MIAIRPVGLRQNRFAASNDRRLGVSDLDSEQSHSAARQIVGICLGAIVVTLLYLAQGPFGL
ncbi:MAG: hypothetical protein ACK44L_01650 [Burkholderiales bacterium]